MRPAAALSLRRVAAVVFCSAFSLGLLIGFISAWPA